MLIVFHITHNAFLYSNNFLINIKHSGLKTNLKDTYLKGFTKNKSTYGKYLLEFNQSYISLTIISNL